MSVRGGGGRPFRCSRDLRAYAVDKGSPLNVVTGATGFIGGVLTRALADRDGKGSARGVVHHRKPWFEEPGIDWVEGDVLDRDSMLAAFRGADVVYHLGSLVSMDPRMANAVRDTTMVGTRNVVEAALECGVRRMIHVSSIHAYDQLPVHEVLHEGRDRAGGPHYTVYELAKMCAEEEVRRGVALGLDAVILNPTGVIGPYDAEPSYLGQFFVDLYRRNLPVLVTGGFDWVDVRDVVAAALAAATRGRCGENYILSGRWHSMVELARMCQTVTGVPVPRFVCPLAAARIWAPVQVAWDRFRGLRPRFTRDALTILETSNRRVSNAKARRELGFDPRPAADSVRDTYRWFEQNGKLAVGAPPLRT